MQSILDEVRAARLFPSSPCPVGTRTWPQRPANVTQRQRVHSILEEVSAVESSFDVQLTTPIWRQRTAMWPGTSRSCPAPGIGTV